MKATLKISGGSITFSELEKFVEKVQSNDHDPSKNVSITKIPGDRGPDLISISFDIDI